MVAHVGDFGLARLLSTTKSIPENQTSTTDLKESIGYAAPGNNCILLYSQVFINPYVFSNDLFLSAQYKK